MPKRVLFILPSIWAGGTHSSLSSIMSHYNPQLWKVSVFAITGYGERESPYKQFLLPRNKTLAALFSHPSEQGGRSFYTRAVKILNKILSICGYDFKEHVLRRCVSHLEKKGYDTVVGFMEGTSTRMASLFHCQRRVAWIHCNYDMYLPAGKSEESIYKAFDKIVCVSQYTASVFKQRYPALASKTEFVYNMMDTDRILSMSEAPPDDIRFQKKGMTLLSVGRVTKVKRFPEIPSIAKYLKQRGVSFMWYLVGPCFDESEAAKIRHNIDSLDVGDCFVWLGGKDNPYPYFKHSDIYVCVSESEACPMVFNEARLFGLPIVSTDFPSAIEFVDSGTDGVVVSLDSLPEALYSLISSPDNYRNMKEHSIARSIDNDSIMNEIENILSL